jgi:hypothetical protein
MSKQKFAFAVKVAVTARSGVFERDVVVLVDNEMGIGIEAAIDEAKKQVHGDPEKVFVRQVQYVGTAYEVAASAEATAPELKA